jgi:alkylation response protein AidB-like acyl-CoA dehydrogenase
VERRGDYYVLYGKKAGISVATEADVFIIFAKTEPEMELRAYRHSWFMQICQVLNGKGFRI